MDINKSSQDIINVVLRVMMLLFILVACFILLKPFLGIILWGVILSLALYPLFKRLEDKLGGRKKLAVILIIIMGMLIILIPSGLFLDSIIGGVTKLKNSFMDGREIQIPLPGKNVAEWPLIGDKVYELWTDASENLAGLLKKYSKFLMGAGNVFVKQVLGIGSSVGQFFIATIVAGVILLLPGIEELSKTFIIKIAGEKGEEIVDLIRLTVINVLKGIFGMAFIQSVLLGIGMLLAGVPHAGLWTLLVFILSVLQIPALVIVVPTILYLFSAMNVVPAILWSVFLLLAGASDNILKPILLGKGAPVPMLVIFLGVLGGFISFGFVGLFTGAIILSIGYRLFISWLREESAVKKIS